MSNGMFISEVNNSIASMFGSIKDWWNLTQQGVDPKKAWAVVKSGADAVEVYEDGEVAPVYEMPELHFDGKDTVLVYEMPELYFNGTYKTDADTTFLKGLSRFGELPLIARGSGSSK